MLLNWEDSCIKCTSCGWPAYAITSKEAEAEIERFNTYFDSLSGKEQQANYGGKRSALDSYLSCSRCKSKDFRRIKKGEVSDSITLTPTVFDLTNATT